MKIKQKRTPEALNQDSYGLCTDLYELTMAYGYWKNGMEDTEAVFHHFFRSPPFGGQYVMTAGLAPLLTYLENFTFDPSDIKYLSSLKTAQQTPLFEAGFLDYLSKLRLQCDLDAIPEGTLVFPNEPLIRVQGPLIQAQLIESIVLNTINFQSLIATKASRTFLAAKGDPILEFGLRRAQGLDGALSASRAAFIGGCTASSNTLAGKLYGIPVSGTQAHSWVMSFNDEETAFQAYRKALPDQCSFIIDTYDTLTGLEEAIKIGKDLRREGKDLLGVRLDSGDLSSLSRAARIRLDTEGFTHTAIIASNELDEDKIKHLKEQGAAITVWGVGTSLCTAAGAGALDGVYKLAAIRHSKKEPWRYTMKISGGAGKTSLPGHLQVRRYTGSHDLIYDTYTSTLSSTQEGYVDLLQAVLRNGILCTKQASLFESKERSINALNKLDLSAEYPIKIHESVLKAQATLQNQYLRKDHV